MKIKAVAAMKIRAIREPFTIERRAMVLGQVVIHINLIRGLKFYTHDSQKRKTSKSFEKVKVKNLIEVATQLKALVVG